MELSGRRVFFSGLLKATTGRLNLCMAGLTAAGAWMLESWVVFGVSAGGYAAAVMLDLWRPALWRTVGAELRRRGPVLSEELDFGDEDARSCVRRLANAREERGRALAVTREPHRGWEQVRSVLEVAAAVERQVVELIPTFDRLARYLSDKNLAKSRLQLEQAAMWKAGPERAAAIRAERELAYRAAEERVQALEALVTHKDAIAARLDALLQGLEMLPHRLLVAAMQEEIARPTSVPSPLLEMETELRRLEEVTGVVSDAADLGTWNGGAYQPRLDVA